MSHKCIHIQPGFVGLKKMCMGIYEQPGCGTGGPLHILLDDNNYDTRSILFCLNECLKHDNDYVRTLGSLICAEYLRMDLQERAVFDAYWCGQRTDIECGYNCTECELLGETYEYMLEAEEAFLKDEK